MYWLKEQRAWVSMVGVKHILDAGGVVGIALTLPRAIALHVDLDAVRELGGIVGKTRK